MSKAGSNWLCSFCILTMKALYSIILTGFIALLSGCSVSEPVFLSRSNDSVDSYKYVCIVPTQSVIQNVNVGQTYGMDKDNASALYSTTTVQQKTTPSEVIAAYVIKKGYVVVPEIVPSIADKTIIVNCVESNRRVGGSYIEMTIQCVSAKSYDVICTCSAESSWVGTAPQKVKEAVEKCLKVIF